jgi:hypothetical protein
MLREFLTPEQAGLRHQYRPEWRALIVVSLNHQD